MKTADLDYHLPPELIAQTPMEPRDHSRLLVIHRDSGALEHCAFRDLTAYLRPGDVLVANDSRVLPARLRGRKLGSGGAVEVLLIQQETPDVWRSLVKPGRRVQDGTVIVFEPETTFTCPTERAAAGPDELRAEVLDRGDDGIRRLRFSSGGDELSRALENFGVMPLPPYIHAPLSDQERYQTVYSKPVGSVAAPTAGLHFTPELLDQLRESGVQIHYVTCHIGLHTFRPIQAGDVEQHEIHQELAIVPAEVANACNAAHTAGKRVIAVGTSTVRSLESACHPERRAKDPSPPWTGDPSLDAQDDNQGTDPDKRLIVPFAGWTGLYIYPGYTYRAVDAMITNFHLPKTTLLALVSAFASRELILKAYEEAIGQRYRFYSFGDACLIL